jgi:hypothetical protein
MHAPNTYGDKIIMKLDKCFLYDTIHLGATTEEPILLRKIVILISCLFFFVWGSQGYCGNKQPSAKRLENKKEQVLSAIEAYGREAKLASSRFGSLSPAEIIAFVIPESTGNPNAVSSKNARGLYQTRGIANKASGIQCNQSTILCQTLQGVGYMHHLITVEGFKDYPTMVWVYLNGPGNYRKYRPSMSAILNHSYVKKVMMYKALAEEILNG